MLEELSKLRANLDQFYWAIEDGRQWKKEVEKWNYYRAKLLILQTDLKNARNTGLG